MVDITAQPDLYRWITFFKPIRQKTIFKNQGNYRNFVQIFPFEIFLWGVVKTITALVSVGLLYLTNNSALCITRFMLALSKITVNNIRYISGDFVRFDLLYLGNNSF